VLATEGTKLFNLFLFIGISNKFRYGVSNFVQYSSHLHQMMNENLFHRILSHTHQAYINLLKPSSLISCQLFFLCFKKTDLLRINYRLHHPNSCIKLQNFILYKFSKDFGLFIICFLLYQLVAILDLKYRYLSVVYHLTFMESITLDSLLASFHVLVFIDFCL